MKQTMQLATGSALLACGPLLAVYTVIALRGVPYVCAMVVLWLLLVEYAVARAWWQDVVEVFPAAHTRRGAHR